MTTTKPEELDGDILKLADTGHADDIARTKVLETWFQGMAPGGLQGVMLNSTDIDADHKTLSSRGVSLSPIDQQPWSAVN